MRQNIKHPSGFSRQAMLRLCSFYERRLSNFFYRLYIFVLSNMYSCVCMYASQTSINAYDITQELMFTYVQIMNLGVFIINVLLFICYYYLFILILHSPVLARRHAHDGVRLRAGPAPPLVGGAEALLCARHLHTIGRQQQPLPQAPHHQRFPG